MPQGDWMGPGQDPRQDEQQQPPQQQPPQQQPPQQQQPPTGFEWLPPELRDVARQIVEMMGQSIAELQGVSDPRRYRWRLVVGPGGQWYDWQPVTPEQSVWNQAMDYDTAVQYASQRGMPAPSVSAGFLENVGHSAMRRMQAAQALLGMLRGLTPPPEARGGGGSGGSNWLGDLIGSLLGWLLGPRR